MKMTLSAGSGLHRDPFKSPILLNLMSALFPSFPERIFLLFALRTQADAPDIVDTTMGLPEHNTIVAQKSTYRAPMREQVWPAGSFSLFKRTGRDGASRGNHGN